MKSALITGITGQDGSYLAELLLDKGYEVHGLVRRSSSFNTDRIDHIFDRLHLHYGDLTDGGALATLMGRIKPDEVYNLGAQSHVKVSFEMPHFTVNSAALGTLNLLEAIRHLDNVPRYYQASSSEMFGGCFGQKFLTENSPFHPRSPYACGKVYAYHQTINYREAYQIHASNGILFNHESPRRGETFVTRKITKAVVNIAAGLQEEVRLGNLNAKRDWGYAKDYVEAMWLMLQQEEPDDFVIATGETHSVFEFCEEAFGYAGLDWHRHVIVDPKYFRPSEVDVLLGDATKAQRKLRWKPKTTFKELVKIMVDADQQALLSS